MMTIATIRPTVSIPTPGACVGGATVVVVVGAGALRQYTRYVLAKHTPPVYSNAPGWNSSEKSRFTPLTYGRATKKNAA